MFVKLTESFGAPMKSIRVMLLGNYEQKAQVIAALKARYPQNVKTHGAARCFGRSYHVIEFTNVEIRIFESTQNIQRYTHGYRCADQVLVPKGSDTVKLKTDNVLTYEVDTLDGFIDGLDEAWNIEHSVVN